MAGRCYQIGDASMTLMLDVLLLRVAADQATQQRGSALQLRARRLASLHIRRASQRWLAKAQTLLQLHLLQSERTHWQTAAHMEGSQWNRN